MALKSRQELYTIMKDELQAQYPGLTDYNAGSILDAILGAVSTALSEQQELVTTKFNKTFFELANGPEVTGDADDLETLAIDHFGTEFARPAATKAVGIVTFSRANSNAGDCVIPAGTVVKTEADANGESQSFTTLLSVTMTGTSINASVEAVEAGIDGNVDEDTVVLIEDTLTDPSIEVNNDEAMSGGAEEQSDADYRETILEKIRSLRGATADAIEAAALTVSGIVSASAIESFLTAIEYDPGTEEVSGDYFLLPVATLYIADANGEANDALIALVDDAVDEVRACGIKVTIVAATPYSLNWTAEITLNPGGPNYSTLQSDATLIENSMNEYITGLAVGDGFDRDAADAAMLDIWGPDGTDDITAFATTVPVGDVAGVVGQKIVPGTVTIE
jgi:hypothetical protein